MNKQRRVARHQQYAACYLGAQLESDKQKYFLGTAKVDIDAFSFDSFLPRDLNLQNSERLLSVYELTGCSQLDTANRVPALIADNDFTEAVARADSTVEKARHHDHLQWPTLSLPADAKIECLRGKHRIEAAKLYLRSGFRWWSVDFYSSSEFPMLHEDVTLNYCGFECRAENLLEHTDLQ